MYDILLRNPFLFDIFGILFRNEKYILRHDSRFSSIHFYLTPTDIQELCGKTKKMSERETCLNARK